MKGWTRARAWRMRRRLARALEPVTRHLFLDLGDGHRDAIVISGSERSGTTWLAELVNHRRAYRLVFEPFAPDRVALCRDLRRQPYARPADADPELLRIATRILSGRVRSRWTDRFHGPPFPRRRIVKDVRTNLLLRWIREHFPETPIVLVLRHPCAVARSQLTRKVPLPDPAAEFLSQPALVEDFLGPVASEIRGAPTYFEKLVFRWCIQNSVPLRQFRRGELHVAFYENLCRDPSRELAALFSFLGLRADARVLGRVARPSVTSHGYSAIISGDDLLDGWRRDITAAQVARAREILSLFGLDAIYGAGSWPDVAGLGGVVAGGCRRTPSPRSLK